MNIYECNLLCISKPFPSGFTQWKTQHKQKNPKWRHSAVNFDQINSFRWKSDVWFNIWLFIIWWKVKIWQSKPDAAISWHSCTTNSIEKFVGIWKKIETVVAKTDWFRLVLRFSSRTVLVMCFCVNSFDEASWIMFWQFFRRYRGNDKSNHQKIIITT